LDFGDDPDHDADTGIFITGILLLRDMGILRIMSPTPSIMTTMFRRMSCFGGT